MRVDCDGLRVDCDGLRVDCDGWIAMDCDGWITMMYWMDCDGLDGLRRIAMDCDGLHWNGWIGSLNSRRIKHPFTLMLSILITHDARAPTIQVHVLKTAPRAQNGAVRSNGAARSKRRCAFKRGSAGGRQGVGRLVRRGRQKGSAEGVGRVPQGVR